MIFLHVVGALLGLTSLVLLGLWFRRLLLQGRGLTLALVLLSLVLFESILYQGIDVPYGLFHLHAGGAQVRTLDLVFLVAIVARGTLPEKRPLDLLTGAWLAFALWMTVEALLGKLNGNPGTYIIWEYKTFLYLGLGYAVSVARFDRPDDVRLLARFCIGTAVLAGLLTATTFAHLQVAIGGVLGTAQLGEISSISATIFPMIGIVSLCLFLCSSPLRFELLVCALVLFATALAPSQRASALNLGVSLLALILLLPLGVRHLRVTLVQVVLCIAAVIMIAGSAWVIDATVTGNGQLPYTNNVVTVLHGGEKKLSAEDRINQLTVAKSLIRQHPIIGWGLGETITYYEVGLKQFVTIILSHNIITDLLIRTGVVGLLLFLVAFVLSVNDLVRCWRSAFLVPSEAALALAVAAILAGWFSHGMVESLFEHTRLTPYAFALLGLTRSASRRSRIAERAAEVERARTESYAALRVRSRRQLIGL